MKKLRINPKCVAEELNDQLIILNIENGTYHELNATGTIIWREIESNNSSVHDLQTRFKSKIRSKDFINIEKFISRLIERGLLMETDETKT